MKSFKKDGVTININIGNCEIEDNYFLEEFITGHVVIPATKESSSGIINVYNDEDQQNYFQGVLYRYEEVEFEKDTVVYFKLIESPLGMLAKQVTSTRPGNVKSNVTDFDFNFDFNLHLLEHHEENGNHRAGHVFLKSSVEDDYIKYEFVVEGLPTIEFYSQNVIQETGLRYEYIDMILGELVKPDSNSEELPILLHAIEHDHISDKS